MADPIIPDDSISGNKVHGGVISEFQSVGIQDLATQTSLIVTNGTATVDRIRTKILDGNVSVNGNLLLSGSMSIAETVEFNKDLNIQGNLSADTITVRKLVADVKQETREPITFVGLQASDLTGKGLLFKAGDVNKGMLYRNGRLVSSIDLDVAGASYYANGVEVLTDKALGATVATSNLRQVGRLTGLAVDGTAQFNSSVVIDGSLKVNGLLEGATIRASQVITEGGASLDVGNFTANSEQALNGQGLHFVYGDVDNMLVYREGSRLWSTLDFDVQEGRGYKIDNTPVLTANELGSTVTKSSLKQVGALNSLRVRGDSTLGDFAFFQAEDQRVGFGTENPNGALGISTNNLEIVLTSTSVGRASIGTYTNDGVDIITDNIARISVANSGEVTIGHPEYRNGVLRVNGKLYVDEVIADTRLLRSTSLQFQSVGEDTYNGKGIEWVKGNNIKQLVFQPNPDRITSTENFEIADGKYYAIDGREVLSKTALGPTVTASNLTSVGTLNSLTVIGATQLGSVTAGQITLTDGTQSFTVTKNGFDSGETFNVNRQGETEFSIDANGIVIGNPQNTNRAVRVFGRMGVGVNNPNPNVGLAVAGNFSFADKQFVTGTSAPTEGSFKKGDICWNSDPIQTSYVGWICIVEGTPGEWRPFGLIA